MSELDSCVREYVGKLIIMIINGMIVFFTPFWRRSGMLFGVPKTKPRLRQFYLVNSQNILRKLRT
jgi:hypothetical protein